MDNSPSGSSVYWILQARILEWVAMSPSKGSSCPRIEPDLLYLPVLAGGFFTTRASSKGLGSPVVGRESQDFGRTRMVISQVSSESLEQATKCESLASHGKEFKSKSY